MEVSRCTLLVCWARVISHRFPNLHLKAGGMWALAHLGVQKSGQGARAQRAVDHHSPRQRVVVAGPEVCDGDA